MIRFSWCELDLEHFIGSRKYLTEAEILGGTDLMSDICTISNKSSITRWSIQLILYNNRFICCHQVQTVESDKQLAWIGSEVFLVGRLFKTFQRSSGCELCFLEIYILLLVHLRYIGVEIYLGEIQWFGIDFFEQFFFSKLDYCVWEVLFRPGKIN